MSKWRRITFEELERRVEERMNRRLEYEKWKELVDRLMFERFGMDTEFIPDFDYTKAYNDGWSVLRTVNAAMSNARRF